METEQKPKQEEPDPKPEPKQKKQKPVKVKKKQNAFRKHYKWFIFIPLFSFVIAFVFGLASEALLGTNTSIILCVAIIVVLIIIAFVGDIFAVAGAYAEIENFNAMASRRIKGAKAAIKLVKNSDRVSSILSDIIGDVCGIVSGAMGVALSLIIINEGDYSFFWQAFIIAIINAGIAAIAITAKSVAKKIAIKNSTAIVMFFGKVLAKFGVK